MYIKDALGLGEAKMFYRHLKKIALALTSFFWAGCDDSGSSAVCLYGPDPNYSSAAENLVSSSSEATKESSSSSEMQQPIALYGVPNDIANCYLNKGDSTVHCGDRTVCKQLTEERWESEYKCIEDICPDYGVVRVSENTYECDGKVYSEAEFRSKYNIAYEYDPSKEPITCNESDENTVTCNDGVTYTVTTDEKGNKTYTDGEGNSLSEIEFNEKYEIKEEMYAPLYGISW